MRLLSGLASFFFAGGLNLPSVFFVGPVPSARKESCGGSRFRYASSAQQGISLSSFFLFVFSSFPFSQGTDKKVPVCQNGLNASEFVFFKMGMGNFSVQMILNVLNVLNVFKVVTVFEE